MKFVFIPVVIFFLSSLQRFTKNYSELFAIPENFLLASGITSHNLFETQAQAGNSVMIYSSYEFPTNQPYQRRKFLAWPVYWLEPSKIIYNDLARIAEVQLIYTNPESLENLERTLGEEHWTDFRYVQKYGDYSLLARQRQR